MLMVLKGFPPFSIESTLGVFRLPLLIGAFSFFSFLSVLVCLKFVFRFNVLIILSLWLLVVSCGVPPNLIWSVGFPRPLSAMSDACPPARYGLWVLGLPSTLCCFCAHFLVPWLQGLLPGDIAAVGHSCVQLLWDCESLCC